MDARVMLEAKNMKELVLNHTWCKGCGICVTFCPKHVLKLEHGKVSFRNAAACVGCGKCESLCPDYALSLVESRIENAG